ncbi:MAG: hypothetical protein IBJ18_07795 [Phycisphaerales bacterium]|nr:hypothetical protein [Phycisphaerales bacterium]
MNDQLMKQLDELGMRARCAWPDEVDHEPPAAVLEAAKQARHAAKIAQAGRVGMIAAGVMLAVIVGVGVHRSLEHVGFDRDNHHSRTGRIDPRLTDPDDHAPRLRELESATATTSISAPGGPAIQPDRGVEAMPITTEPGVAPITVAPMSPKPKPGEPQADPSLPEHERKPKPSAPEPLSPSGLL